MCGRYNLLPDAKAWIDGFEIARDLLSEIEWRARYNIAPGQSVPIIRAVAGGDALVIDKARWGFVPHWMQDEKPKIQPINARDDGVASKPFFREAFRHRRCLFPASGFYEWKSERGRKQPYNITMTDGRVFLMAGIWDNWRGDDTAAIITTSANELMATIHERMPVIIEPSDAMDWITGKHPLDYLKPYDSTTMHAYAVSTAVNNARYDDPENVRQLDD